MLTFTPKEYRPFKRRIVPALLATLLMPIIMSIIAYRSNTLIYNIEFGGILSLFVFPLGLYYAIYNFDSIVLDEKRKTIHIQIRKFDKIIDKGEYPIDGNLVIEIVKKVNAAGVSHRFLFAYKDERIVPSGTSGDGWTLEMYKNVCDEVEKIKKSTSSI